VLLFIPSRLTYSICILQLISPATLSASTTAHERDFFHEIAGAEKDAGSASVAQKGFDEPPLPNATITLLALACLRVAILVSPEVAVEALRTTSVDEIRFQIAETETVFFIEYVGSYEGGEAREVVRHLLR